MKQRIINIITAAIWMLCLYLCWIEGSLEMFLVFWCLIVLGMIVGLSWFEKKYLMGKDY